MFLIGAAGELSNREVSRLMSGFAKIFASMLRSTVWVGQPWHVKLTWITLLMLADADGNVWASIPGLAKDAEVTDEQCEQALALFMAPDRRSRTKAHEGRRIVEIDGGWHILNHRKYRELQTRKQAQHAKAQRDYYERKKAQSGGFETLAPSISTISTDAPDSQVLAEASVYGSRARKPRKKSASRKAQAGETIVSSISTDAPDVFPASASVDPLAGSGSRNPDPDPIPNHPAKDGSARARNGVFEAPVLPAKTCDVPAWWFGPNERHMIHAELGVDVAREAAKFRVHHFQAPFPATPEGIDRRFEQWLLNAKNEADTERGKAFALQQGAAPTVRRGRMPTNGVAQLQPDEGRTGLESLDIGLPEPEPERPRRAARR